MGEPDGDLDRHGDAIQIDARIVARLRNRVLHEHRRDDEEARRDRDLPSQEDLLPPPARRSDGRPGGERAAQVDRACQLDRRLERRSRIIRATALGC
jgi:hypothetical protein